MRKGEFPADDGDGLVGPKLREQGRQGKRLNLCDGVKGLHQEYEAELQMINYGHEILHEKIRRILPGGAS